MKNISFLLFGLVLLLSCNREPIKEFNLSPILNMTLTQLEIQDTAKLDLCKINEFDWQELIIVPPYATMSFLDSLELKNKRDIKEEIKSVEANDFRTLYLFVNKDSIVRYYIIKNTDYPIIDLTKINYETQRKRLSKIDLCNKLFVEKKGQFFHLKM